MLSKRIYNLLILILFVPFILKAEITVFKTYEDFLSDKGETYEEYKNHIAVMGSVKLILMKDRKKKTINCKDIWGFRMDDMLFRVHKKFKQPAKVMYEGSVVYYENGLAHLEMIKQDREFINITTGYAVYFSKDLSSELVPMPSSGQTGGKGYKKFKNENPKLQSFFKCVDQAPVFYSIRECVKTID